jgi:site-specific DNA-methyltransferase (adenine-specific)
VNRVVFSSKRMDWRTPADVYAALQAEFGFDFDPCPPDPAFDGLAIPWGASNFVNPPYGRQLPKWVAKAHKEAQLGKTVVMLVPSRTDTRWWHDHAMTADEIRCVKGRLKFQGAAHNAPFPSCVIIWRGEAARRQGRPVPVTMTAEAPRMPGLAEPGSPRGVRPAASAAGRGAP